MADGWTRTRSSVAYPPGRAGVTPARSLSGQLSSLAIGRCQGVLAPVWCGQIVVRSCQVAARAFAFIWSNSAWVIVPASRSCLADAI